MKTIIKFSILAVAMSLAYFSDISFQPAKMTIGLEFVSEAQAVLGVRRRSARRGAAVGYEAGAAAANSANATAAQTAAPAAAPAAAPTPPVYGPLPVGTVISVLPADCAPVTAAGVQYQHCGDNFFQAVLQGSNLVYITATPAQ